jgi:hypothetical protein
MLEVYLDKAGKKVGFRKVIAALGTLYTVKLPLRKDMTMGEERRENLRQETYSMKAPKLLTALMSFDVDNWCFFTGSLGPGGHGATKKSYAT